MQKFSHFITENKSMSYTNIFGKKTSHLEALQKDIQDKLYAILSHEKTIDEKDFANSDVLSKEIAEFFKIHHDLYLKANDYYQANKRLELLAEEIYQDYFNGK